MILTGFYNDSLLKERKHYSVMAMIKFPKTQAELAK